MPIITTAEYKTFAGITGTASDARLNVIIPALQAQLERLTGRKFDSDEFTEYYDGQWASSIQLRSMPIDEIASVSFVDIDRTVLYVVPAIEYTFDVDTGTLSWRVLDSASIPTGCDGWGSSSTYGNGEGYLIGDSPQFSNSVYRGVKVVYTAGYEDADMPLDLKLLMFDLVGTALATVNADWSMKSETLGHYRYDRRGGNWIEAFSSRINAWKVYS